MSQERAVGRWCEGTIDQPLFLSDHHAVSHSDVGGNNLQTLGNRETTPGEWSCHPPRLEIEEERSEQGPPARTTEAQRPRRLPRDVPGECSIRHSGNASGRTRAAAFCPMRNASWVSSAGAESGIFGQGNASPVVDRPGGAAEDRIGKEQKPVLPCHGDVALDANTPAQLDFQFQVVDVLVTDPTQVLPAGLRLKNLFSEPDFGCPDAVEQQLAVLGKLDTNVLSTVRYGQLGLVRPPGGLHDGQGGPGGMVGGRREEGLVEPFLDGVRPGRVNEAIDWSSSSPPQAIAAVIHSRRHLAVRWLAKIPGCRRCG